MKVYIMVGIPGSGKSTLARSLGCRIICPDEIRKALSGDAADQTKNDEVFKLAYEELNDAITKQQDVVFDATNLSERIRRKIITRCPAEAEIIALVKDVPFGVALERNNNRDRVVPEYAMKRMFKNFEYPLPCEGFNQIIFC